MGCVGVTVGSGSGMSDDERPLLHIEVPMSMDLGEELTRNIQRVAHDVENHKLAVARLRWIDLLLGDWNYKTTYDNPIYQDLGNFNFAVTGRAGGYADTQLLIGAGLFQSYKNVRAGKLPFFHTLPCCLMDERRDYAMSLAGFRFYDALTTRWGF